MVKQAQVLLKAVLLLASLLVPGIASASTAAGAETRVWAFDLADESHVGVEPSLTLELHRGCAPTYDQLASDSLLAARGGAKAVDASKLHHIFDKAGRNLDDVVRATGSREAAFGAMERGAQAAVDAGKLTGKFETVVNIGGTNVTVRGMVVDGVANTGTAFRTP